MRITPEERTAILACARRRFGEGAVVRLFGSRTDDAARGGDIDLHIEADDRGAADIESEIAFLLELKTIIGEQRIDLVLRRPGYAPRAIDRIAVSTGLRL